MAKKGKGAQKSRKEQYGAYKAKSSYQVNKAAKVARHLKAHPNDAQAAAVKAAAVPPRKPSGNKIWSGPARMLAAAYRKVGLKGSYALVSHDLPAHTSALA